MRASLQAVAEAMKSSRIPKLISQEPFDYDPGHYKRLCHLEGGQASPNDLCDYALDMTHMELQPDLLRHLMPVFLDAWKRDLFEGSDAGLVGYVEHFWPALLQGKALKEVLSKKECDVVMRFMRDSILDRLDAEDSLTFSGMRASPYGWVSSLVSFGVIFPDVDSLWTEWWQMKTPGHATTAFQYASALLYEADKNPVFAPWTRDEGGGAPALWECGWHLFDVGWRQENLDFLRQILSVEYIQQHLIVGQGLIQNTAASSIASRMIADLPAQTTLLALRIEELPSLLKNLSSIEGFTI